MTDEPRHEVHVYLKGGGDFTFRASVFDYTTRAGELTQYNAKGLSGGTPGEEHIHGLLFVDPSQVAALTSRQITEEERPVSPPDVIMDR